jgi:hypothetical protein
MKFIISYLDDIFLLLGLIAIVTASYMQNAILGTYTLGIAFLFVAFIASKALQNPAIQQIIEIIRKGSDKK